MPTSSRNSGYSASQLSSMQQDAIERVRDMQRRARERVEQSNRQAAAPAPQPEPAAGPPPVPKNPPMETSSGPPQGSQVIPAPARQNSAIKGIIDRLGMDGETGLILLLLFLLLNEGANQTVVLALVYILMG